MVPMIVIVASMVVVGVLYLRASRPVRLPHAIGDWGAKGHTDPRVVAAAMMFVVAREAGRVGPDKAEQLREMLVDKLALSPEAASECLDGGQRLARRLKGSLNSRLHQLRGSIEAHCSTQEKQDVVDLLRAVAGPNIERVPSIRDALGRIAASLLHG